MDEEKEMLSEQGKKSGKVVENNSPDASNESDADQLYTDEYDNYCPWE